MKAENFFDDSEALRNSYGKLLHTEAENIALTPSASYGLAIAALNLRFKTGQHILVLEEQFPSNVYAWRQLAVEQQLTLRTVKRPNDGDWTSAVVRALDDSVGLVAVPHCHWVDGGLLDLKSLGPTLASRSVSLVVDVTQSLGVVDFNADAIGADFVVGAGYKWLLGPYAQAFLYVHPRHHSGTPLEHNWIARAGSEDFAQLVNYTSDYQPGARRFDMGERSNFITVPMMNAALEMIEEWTVPEIEGRIDSFTRSIANTAEQAGYRTLAEEHRSPHYLALECPTSDANALRAELHRAHVHVSVRGPRVRLSPHVYNNDNDLDRLCEALRKG